ncbi:MAG: pyridinium-3,5-biscarboxylic acid mononucleotide sulfurtransferase [Candidatus Sumerlaeota bacterium]|nr:pyridinium-3,5-biscarboxylic acid mononucleotide sulfurtransferase [Candidatus Sumerlaeota bacterium]
MTDSLQTTDAATLASQLEEHLAAFGSVLVAYSGGVDSTVVLRAATAALGERALGVLADTESNTDEDIALARRIAEEHSMRLEIVEYSELAIENYADNPVNRCFFCKDALYGRLAEMAARHGIETICDGSNADDGGDYRPGLKAVANRRVRSPLREIGITKAAVRALAHHYGLPNHDKPSSPCLSSRIPYGQRVTRGKLDQVGAAEQFLRGLGLREFRCRHHGDIARLELMPGDFPLALERRDEIVDALRALGFQWVALDLAGFRSGGLNRVLTPAQRRQHTHASMDAPEIVPDSQGEPQ